MMKGSIKIFLMTAAGLFLLMITLSASAAQALPDLVVTSVGMTLSSPAPGQAVLFKAQVKNIGKHATPAGSVIGVNFLVDGKQVSWSDSYKTSLAPGASVTLSANAGPAGVATWTAASGSHTVQAWVNDVQRFQESSFSNNKRSLSFSVTAPVPSPTSTPVPPSATPSPTPAPTATPIAGVSVRNFGAKGDGVTDDQAALQAAFNYGKANKVPVYVPAGQYLHSGRLLVDSTVVYGDAPGQTVLKATTYIKAAIDLRGTAPALYNLSIVGTGGSRSSDRGGNGVYIFQSDRYVVKNCYVKNSSGAGIMTEQGSNGKILNNFVELTGADGIYSTEGTYNLEVAFNKTNNTGDDALSFTSYQSAAGFVHDINVHDNTVVGNWQSRSITVNGGYNITIQNNYVDGGTAGISVGATTDWGSLQDHDITVANNTVKNATYTGEGTIGGGALHLYNNAGGNDYNIVFRDNDVYKPAHHGIYVWGTNQIQATIYNNRFYMDSTHQVFVNGDRGATQINEYNNLRYDASMYPGDKILPRGGIDPNFRYK